MFADWMGLARRSSAPGGSHGSGADQDMDAGAFTKTTL